MLIYPASRAISAIGFIPATQCLTALSLLALLSALLTQSLPALALLAAVNLYFLLAIISLCRRDYAGLRALLLDESQHNQQTLDRLFHGPLRDAGPLLLDIHRHQGRHNESSNNTVDEIAFASQELSSTAEQLASNTLQQSQSTHSIAAAVTQISQSIEDVSQRIRQALQEVQDNRTLSDNGSEAVQQARINVDGVALLSEQAHQQLNELDSRSSEVANISSLIREIAEQTNLLALNAAIEAARAGEHGRGFAVVADEVRALANRSHDSAKQISANIDAVQQQMGLLKQGMTQVLERVETTVTQTTDAESVLEGIRRHNQQVADLVGDIAAASEQQSVAANEISSRVEEVAQASEHNQHVASQAADVARHLHHLTTTREDNS